MKIDNEQLMATVNKFKNEPLEKSEAAVLLLPKLGCAAGRTGWSFPRTVRKSSG